jgi:anti-sigma regulatory factor (Ser/Thr protein kinase)
MFEKKLTIINQISQLEELARFFEEISDEWELPMSASLNLNLVMEELVTNIIFYGYEDQNKHEITIVVILDNELINIQLEDDGKEFDPLSIPEPDINLAIEDRKIGGLGIHFVRKIMDKIDYKRLDNRNILTLSKNISQN